MCWFIFTLNFLGFTHSVLIRDVTKQSSWNASSGTVERLMSLVFEIKEVQWSVNCCRFYKIKHLNEFRLLLLRLTCHLIFLDCTIEVSRHRRDAGSKPHSKTESFNAEKTPEIWIPGPSTIHPGKPRTLLPSSRSQARKTFLRDRSHVRKLIVSNALQLLSFRVVLFLSIPVL